MSSSFIMSWKRYNKFESWILEKQPNDYKYLQMSKRSCLPVNSIINFKYIGEAIIQIALKVIKEYFVLLVKNIKEIFCMQKLLKQNVQYVNHYQYKLFSLSEYAPCFLLTFATFYSKYFNLLKSIAL